VVGSTVIAATVSTPSTTSGEAAEKKVINPAAAASPAADAETASAPPTNVATVPQTNVPETAGAPTARAPDEPMAEGAVASGPKAASATNSSPPASAPSAASAPETPGKVLAPPRPKPAAAATPKPAPAAAPPKAAKPAKAPPPELNPASEALLVEFIERQILPFLEAKRADRHPLANPRFSEDTFRFVKLRVAEAYRARVEEIQGWCDERRMLGRQARMHHWLHGWLFVHVPLSFLLILLTAWHAFVTLFRY
jgi:hypothetical protein